MDKKSNKELVLLLLIFFFGCNNPSPKLNTQQEYKSYSDTLSLKMVGNNLIANVLINDTISGNFIFDTGSHSALLFDSAFAINKKLITLDTNLKDKKKKWINYSAEINRFAKYPTKYKVGSTIDTSMNNPIFNLYRIVGNDAQGLIGMEFFKKHLVEIDYINEKMILHKSQYFEIDEILDTVKIYPVDKQELLFKIKVIFNPGQGFIPFSEDCILDLGVGGSVIPMSTRIVNKHNLLKLKALYPIKRDIKLFTREDVSGFNGKFQSIEFGKFKVDSPAVELLTSKTGMTANFAPLIGNYVFKKYGRIFLDFKKHAIYIPKKLSK